MLAVLRQVGSLMLAFGLLLLATATFNTFAGIRAGIEGFPPLIIGAMMSVFYVGSIIGARYCDRLIFRVGHIRTFTALGAIAAFTVLLHAFWIDPLGWMFLRGILGFAMAGFYICTESWLNERVTPEIRARVLSLHAMVSFLGFGGGQIMINAGDPLTTELFMIAAMLFALGVLPVALTGALHPDVRESVPFGLRALYRHAPVATMSCVAAGMSMSSIFAMGPVFGQDLGFSVAQISALMTALVLSGLFLQLPIGWLSDRHDRRQVIAGVALATALIAAGIAGFVAAIAMQDGFAWNPHGIVLLAMAALFGGTSATLYPLGVAYANDYLAPEERVQAAAGLVFAYGAGSIAGPLLSAGMMNIIGAAGLFAYNAALALALLAFTIYRMTRRTWAGIAPKEAFQAMPDATGTPGGVDYDPRWDADDGASEGTAATTDGER